MPVTVSFDSNGGTGTMADETELYGTASALTTNTFTETGETFTGWDTNSDGTSGTAYADGASYPFTAGTILYAQWAAVPVTVSFDSNGGTGTMADETELYGTASALTTNTFTETGETFTGWDTNSDGTSGTAYADGASYPFTAGTILYAQWTDFSLAGNPRTSLTGNSYLVTLDLFSGDLPPTGTVTISDDARTPGTCSSDVWTEVGSSDDYAAGCSIATAENGGETVIGSYAGSDYVVMHPTNTLTVVPVAATSLALEGSPVESSTGNSYGVVLDTPQEGSDPSPTGTVTVVDSAGGSCTSDDWSQAGGDGGYSVLWTASCSIGTPEAGGVTVSAGYDQSDYLVGGSNMLTVVENSLTLSGNPVTSANGNSYTATLDVPETGSVPVGTVTVTDSNYPTAGTCSSGFWTANGTDGLGGAYYTATCSITSPEIGGEFVMASYSGNYTVFGSYMFVGTAAATLLSLTGSPVASANGNSYTATLNVPGTGPAPTGAVRISDSVATSSAGFCTSSGWGSGTPDITSGTDYTTTCTISSAEDQGETVTASYSGRDYTVDPSSALTVGPPLAISLSLSGGADASEGPHAYTVDLELTSGDPAPTGTVTVHAGSGQCSSNDWADTGSGGVGTDVYDASCTVGTTQAAGQTVNAIYDQSDYTVAQSNTLTVAVAGSIALSGTPLASLSGNSYTVTFDLPASASPPTGSVEVDDNTSGSNCTSSNWSANGPDGFGGTDYIVTCATNGPEVAGDEVIASYDESDYIVGASNTLIVAAAAAISIALSGNPSVSPNGNTYTVTLDTPFDVAPTGDAEIVDTNGGTCSASAWFDEGSDGGTGEDFSATCPITIPETSHDQVSATYDNADYIAGPSDVLLVP